MNYTPHVKNYNSHHDNHHSKKYLDTNFNHEKEYFYQDLTNYELDDIKNYLTDFLFNTDVTLEELKHFLKRYPNLNKGPENLSKLQKIIDEIYKCSADCISLKSYKILTDHIKNEYYVPKPVIEECFFFPGKENEKNVINFLRKPKKTLDIAIFTLTNDYIYAAIEETYKRGVKIRIISDDECLNQIGSDICRLASLGIPVKTDSEVKYHMHHKFAIADKSVVFTGSFNWTTQAVFNNQENVLIIENKSIANEYTEEFERLWSTFKAEVTPEKGKKLYEEQKKR